MDYLEYKGAVEYSKADNCLFGKKYCMNNPRLIAGDLSVFLLIECSSFFYKAILRIFNIYIE